MSPCLPGLRSPGAGRFAGFPLALLAAAISVVTSCGGTKGAPAGGGMGGAGGPSDSGGMGGGGIGGGAGGIGGAGGDSMAAAHAITAFTAAFCAAARTCCAPVPGAEGLLADCETNLSSTSMRYAAIVSGTIVPDLARLPACTAALQQVTAATCLVPDACQNIWLGTKGAGESCSQTLQALECRADAGDTLCYRTTGGMPGVFTGVCQPVVRGVLGTPCVASCGPGITCSQALYATPDNPMAICYTQDGLYCESAACAPIRPTGAACTANPQCGTESYCATTCMPRKAAGQPCLQDNECSQVNHLYCVNDVCSAASLASDVVCGGDLF